MENKWTLDSTSSEWNQDSEDTQQVKYKYDTVSQISEIEHIRAPF